VRPAYIGGTDVASILGLPAYRAPWATWLRFTRDVCEEPETPRMRIGRLLEGVLLDEYRRTAMDGDELDLPRDENGAALRPAFVDSEHSFLGGTPDLLHFDADGRLVVVDCKVTQVGGLARDGQVADLDSGEIPAQWWAQLHHYAWLVSRAYKTTMATEARIYALLSGADLRVIRVPLLLDWWGAEAVPQLVEWWSHVEMGIPPSEPEPVEIAPIPRLDADEAAEAYLEARAAIEAAEERKAQARAALHAALVSAGLPRRSTTASATVSCYTTHAGPTLDRTGLERDYPDLIQRYMLPGAPRTEIRVKRRKP
jgi:predicted phage-related endonuclease